MVIVAKSVISYQLSVIGYQLSSNQKNIVIPSTQCYSFDSDVLSMIVSSHISIVWDSEGAYLPTYSCVEKHLYDVTVKAINHDSVLFEVKLEMGKN